jgi:hypothetical protein
VSGELTYFQEARAGVDQVSDAVMNEQLAAVDVFLHRTVAWVGA